MITVNRFEYKLRPAVCGLNNGKKRSGKSYRKWKVNFVALVNVFYSRKNRPQAIQMDFGAWHVAISNFYVHSWWQFRIEWGQIEFNS